MYVLFCVFVAFVCLGKIIRIKIRKKERRNYNKSMEKSKFDKV